MNLIFFGAPGAGKGTIASMLKEREGIVHISTGDIFRKNIKDKTPLGIKVSTILERGELVPDDLTISLVADRVNEDDCKSGYILDGFPRTLIQAEEWSAQAEVDAAVYFEIDDEEVIRRLSGRRTCSQCSAIYHIEFNKSQKEGICDSCGGDLIIRPDDKVEAIHHRLEVYHTQTKPLLMYYTKFDKIINIDATKKPEEVYQAILNYIRK